MSKQTEQQKRVPQEPKSWILRCKPKKTEAKGKMKQRGHKKSPKFRVARRLKEQKKQSRGKKQSGVWGRTEGKHEKKTRN